MNRDRVHKLIRMTGTLLLLTPQIALGGGSVGGPDTLFPGAAIIGTALLDGRRVIRSDGVKKIREDVSPALHFSSDGRFALCEAACRFGTVKRDGQRKVRLKLAAADRDAVAAETEFAIENELFQARGLIHDIKLVLEGKREMTATIAKNGRKLRLYQRYRYRAKIRQPEPGERIDGKMKLEASGSLSGSAPL